VPLKGTVARWQSQGGTSAWNTLSKSFEFVPTETFNYVIVLSGTFHSNIKSRWLFYGGTKEAL
jgi:hypothetical protein